MSPRSTRSHVARAIVFICLVFALVQIYLSFFRNFNDIENPYSAQFQSDIKPPCQNTTTTPTQLPLLPAPNENDTTWSQKMVKLVKKISPARITELREIFNHFDSEQNPQDVKVIQSTLDNLRNSSDDDYIINQLRVLETFVDQIDNGIAFSTSGGMTVLLQICNNHSSILVRTEVMRTIGIAAQNNDYVIKSAHNVDVVPLILKQLSSKPLLEAGRSPSSDEFIFLGRLIHALSALTRQNKRGLGLLHLLLVPDVLENVVRVRFHMRANQSFDEVDLCERQNDIVVLKVLDFVADVVGLNDGTEHLFENGLWCNLMSCGLTSARVAVRETSIRYLEVSLPAGQCKQQTPEIHSQIKEVVADYEKMQQDEFASKDELDFREDHVVRMKHMIVNLKLKRN